MSHWESSQGGSDLWQTPKYIFDALGCTFDLDVAAPIDGPLFVPAKRWFYENSLQKEWEGFIWMNPPFGGREDKALWLNKFFEYGDGIAFTPDRTSAPWFRRFWARADMVLFVPRVKCILPDGTIGRQPGNGTALWAAGGFAVEVLRRASSRLDGILAQPVVFEISW